MKEIEEDFSLALATGASTTCLCWRLTRADGFVLAMTEHDRPLVVAGLHYEPGGSLDAAGFEASASLAPGQAGARGALSHEGITQADLEAGLWDGARVDIFRADWSAPEQSVHVWSGRLSTIRQSVAGFQAELVSLKADLERPVGRVYGRRCDAAFGDARCGADAGAFPGLACDQRFETCRDVFGNTENFRGFPHLPGTEAMVAGPAPAGNTGGRR